MYDSKATVRAPGTLLRRIGCDIIDLRIKGPAPRARRETQQVSVDTFNALDLRVCKKLESISLPPINGPAFTKSQPRRVPSYVGAALLANYALPTVRKVTIDLHDFTSWATRTIDSVIELAFREFDKFMTQARFLNLQQCSVNVSCRGWNFPGTGWIYREAAYHSLPGLHSRRLVKITSEGW
ncbi:hypothetical protein OH76DRAFT_1484895 [Lentinus brumalis]|uniref:Uncharacterized protein n=1 Tax=Lentinus brumalis TaxID=2498619 RepID=A0A371D444_9APHY|nr:hypothetical protein OH76DRAFT_1484895 [Polyporus brumalis]